MMRRDKILNRIIGIASTNYPDSEMYLYGSQARGDYNSHSDWDILVLLNVANVTFELETKLMDKFYEVELETGEVISPLIYSKNDWNERHYSTPLYENIKNEGVRIR